MAETNQNQRSTEKHDGIELPVSVEESEEFNQPESSKDARNMAMLCHLLGIVGFFAPLIIWLIEKDKHRFVDEHGRAAMNYQISIMIYFAAAWLLIIVTLSIHFVIVGNYVMNALFIIHIVLVIIGAVKAGRGKLWRYPIAISFLK